MVSPHGLQLTLESTDATDVRIWQLNALHGRRAALIAALDKVEAELAAAEEALFGTPAPSLPR